MALWDDINKSLILMEFTIPFKTGFEAAQQRKQSKYLDLLHEAEKTGYTSCLITLEMGSHGLPHMQGFKKLQHQLQIPNKEIHSMLVMAFRQNLVYPKQNFLGSTFRALFTSLIIVIYIINNFYSHDYIRSA